MNYETFKSLLLEDPDFINQIKDLLKDKEQIEKPLETKNKKSNLYGIQSTMHIVDVIAFSEIQEAIMKVKENPLGKSDFYDIKPLTDLASKYKVSNRFFINFYLSVLAAQDLLWEPVELDENGFGLYKITNVFKYNTQRQRLFYLKIPKLKEEDFE